MAGQISEPLRTCLSIQPDFAASGESLQDREVPTSAVVRTPSRQDAQHVDDPSGVIAFEPDSPGAYPQAPFISSPKPHDVASRRIRDQPFERVDDAASNLRIELPDVTGGALR
jgi:hypothetical protein